MENPRLILMLTLVLAAWTGCKKQAETPAGIPPSPAGIPPTNAAPPPQAAKAPPSGEAEMVPAAPAPDQTISGTIVLPAARKKDVSKGDTMFIIARRASGPPLAVQRQQAGDFPMEFSLSNRDAMIPGMPFDGDITITVRVDKDGDPITRKKGDVFGQATGVKVGNNKVTIALDQVQKEDVTLGGPMGGGHGMPPGHP
jgi:cytochrome c-type biogenesis protein CcmH